ncbi:MAG: molybdopterin converting factor subunit 1 [Alteromonadaceae bacterium]|nr:MAG: molybdopterin converting factor subunit 1 [Alteromonadaceae bacterium]
MNSDNASEDNASINILYFASLAESLGCECESFNLACEKVSVADLKQQLAARGEQWQRLINAPSTRCAVNQSLAEDEQVLASNDEVAFFPPVTGG